MKDYNYCCLDFTEHISELNTISKANNNKNEFILKFELFWAPFSFCPFCGEKL